MHHQSSKNVLPHRPGNFSLQCNISGVFLSRPWLNSFLVYYNRAIKKMLRASACPAGRLLCSMPVLTRKNRQISEKRIY